MELPKSKKLNDSYSPNLKKNMVKRLSSALTRAYTDNIMKGLK